MNTNLEQLQQWLSEPEGANLEFKEAKNNFHFEKLVQYCVALANEGGGKIILGVTDLRPRRIVGTTAFAEPGRTEAVCTIVCRTVFRSRKFILLRGGCLLCMYRRAYLVRPGR
jgi:hypothetical protein